VAEGLTKRYFEEILDATGVAKGVKRLYEIMRMPEDEFKGFVEDIKERVIAHYKKNIGQIVKSLQRYEEQPKAFHLGRILHGFQEEVPADWFIRKAALYYGKVVIRDPLESTLLSKNAYATESLRGLIISHLVSLRTLWPWTEAGIIEALPAALILTKLLETISKIADEDYKDEVWASTKGALKDEDLGLEGGALVQYYERFIQENYNQEAIDEYGGLSNLAREVSLRGPSINIALGFFGSVLTDSSPTTDSRYFWRLFGIWSSKRAELLVKEGLLSEETWIKMRNETIAGRVWQGLEIRELGALMKLSPKQIIKVRDDSKYSFKSFREDLAKEVRRIEMEKLGDEGEIKSIISEVSSDLNKEAGKIKEDLSKIRQEFGVEAIDLLDIVFSLTPFPFDLLADLLASSIVDYLRDIRGQKERSGYFLISLEKAEKQGILSRLF